MHDRSIDLARIACAAYDYQQDIAAKRLRMVQEYHDREPGCDVPLWRRLALPVLMGFAITLPVWLLMLGAVVLWAAWAGQPL